MGSEGRDHWNQTWGCWLLSGGLVLVVGAKVGVIVGSAWVVLGSWEPPSGELGRA